MKDIKNEPTPKRHRSNDQTRSSRSQPVDSFSSGPMVRSADLWVTWQLCDSALPTGGFAHSQGLESAVHKGEVRNATDLETFARRALGALSFSTVPLVMAAASSIDEADFNLAAWARLDRLCHAQLSNNMSRKASEACGSALLRTAASIFGSEVEDDNGAVRGAGACLAKARELVRANNNPESVRPRGHFAPVFGLLCGCLQLEPAVAARMFLFASVRDLLSAATRLNLVGPLEASRLLRRLTAVAEGALAASNSASIVSAAPEPPPQSFPASALDGQAAAASVAAAPIPPAAPVRAPTAAKHTSSTSSASALASDSRPEGSCTSPHAHVDKPIDVQIACWQTDPVLDLIQGCHDHLYSRLFVT